MPATNVASPPSTQCVLSETVTVMSMDAVDRCENMNRTARFRPESMTALRAEGVVPRRKVFQQHCGCRITSPTQSRLQIAPFARPWVSGNPSGNRGQAAATTVALRKISP